MSKASSPTTAFQAEHHWLYRPEGFVLLKDYVLHLQHVKAYEVAATMVSGLVADIGCNMGYGTAQLRAAHGPSVVGIDVSERAIRAARERFGGDFRLGNGKRLPCDDAEFDCAVSMQVLEHIPDVPAFLKELRRVVKPSGTVLLSTPNAAMRLAPGQLPWNRFHVREYTASTLAGELSPFFTEVSILGLHGAPELEAIEIGRVSALRKVGKFRGLLAKYVPLSGENWLIELLKHLRRLPMRQLRAHELAVFDTSHLWFQDSELDSSLGLMAVCRC